MGWRTDEPVCKKWVNHIKHRESGSGSGSERFVLVSKEELEDDALENLWYQGWEGEQERVRKREQEYWEWRKKFDRGEVE